MKQCIVCRMVAHDLPYLLVNKQAKNPVSGYYDIVGHLCRDCGDQAQLIKRHEESNAGRKEQTQG